MSPIVPFWFKQRQCKAEAAGEDSVLRVNGPNLGEAFVGIARGENGSWRAFLRQSVDGPEALGTDLEFDSAGDAWQVAFELYRTSTIV